jgi:TonB family protein
MKFLAVLVPFFYSLGTVAQTAGPVHVAPEVASALMEKKVLASYPQKASANGVEGTVVLNVLISDAGAVNEATVVSGDPDLAQAAVDAIKQWKYKPYTADGKPTPVETQVRFGFHLKGPPYSFDQEEATSFPPKLVHLDVSSTPAPQVAGSRLRVSSGVAAGLILKKVEPVYPQEAKDAHIQGIVVLHVIIDTAGNVTATKWVTGPKELFTSAADAVRKWKYRGYLLNGKPIELDTTVEINYRLGR